MSKRYFPIIIALLTFFGSCSKDDVASSGGSNSEAQEKGLTCTVTPIENGDAESRSALTLSSSGMAFAWETGDKLSVFYSEADQTAGIYTLDKIYENNDNTANFKSVGFTLQDGKRYYAISTIERDGVRIPDKRNIELSYAGQVQRGNKNTDHLGDYDYLASSGIADGDDHVFFHFNHLGLTLRVIMEGLPSNVEFTKMEMYDTENSFLQPKRTLDLTKGLAADGTYAPALNPVDMSSAEYKTADRFSLKLENATEADINVADNKGRLEMFIEVPPVDLTGKDIVFMVNGSNGKAYYIKCTGKNLAAGKAYQMKGTAQEAGTYNVKIKVNHAWQHGSTLDSRAATGDPGVDEKFPKPKNLYYVLCVNGKVKAIAPAHSSQSTSAAPVNEIENIPDGSWAESADKTISTYAGELTFNFDSDEMSQTKNVYIVASNNDLTPEEGTNLFASIQNGDDESEVQNLVYSIQEEALGTDYTFQDKTQAFMKNLYSTPWTGSAASFIGNLGADYFKDIILYHVAAKVDLQWNSTLILSGNVSVNNVANESLSLFQPATKNGTTGFIDNDASNNYTVTSPIEADRMYNGRQVFYLPQFNTYNVKVGGNAATDITFSPSTANGWTSWLRWLKKY